MTYEELKSEENVVLPHGQLVEVLDEVEVVRLRSVDGDGLWLVFPDGFVFIRTPAGLKEASFSLRELTGGMRLPDSVQSGRFYRLPDGTEVLAEGDQFLGLPAADRWIAAADDRLYRLTFPDQQLIPTEFRVDEIVLCEPGRQRELWREREETQSQTADQVLSLFSRLLAEPSFAPPDSRVFGVARALVRQWLLWPWPADQVRQALAICGLLRRTADKLQRSSDVSLLEDARIWLHTCRSRE